MTELICREKSLPIYADDDIYAPTYELEIIGVLARCYKCKYFNLDGNLADVTIDKEYDCALHHDDQGNHLKVKFNDYCSKGNFRS